MQASKTKESRQMSKQVRDIVLLKELVRNNYHGWQFIIQIVINYDI